MVMNSEVRTFFFRGLYQLVFGTLIALLLLCFLSCKESEKPLSYSAFKFSNADSLPFISVHRGGKDIYGYPENCLETLDYVNDSIPAIFEIDVAQTADGKLVLMHDNSINRTTTGEGLLRKFTYDELRQFNLVDDYGTITNFKVPLFSEVLEWSKTNNVILTVDVKRSVAQKTVIEAIRLANAEKTCILITYDVKQAKSAYKIAPELVLSVSARNNEEFDRLLKSGIPTHNMVAFTGTRLSPSSLYKTLHDQDILCILGTLGNLDKQAKARGNHLYKNWKGMGVDILATDRPFEAFNAIQKTNKK